MEIWITNDPDNQYIINGIQHGFFITKENSHPVPAKCSNYSSATCHDNIQRVEHQIQNELYLGRYHVCPETPTLVSAIGAIPKPDSSDLRIIQDFSRQPGRSVKCVAGIRPKQPSHRIRLPSQVKADLKYYIQWCSQFNGVVLLLGYDKPQPNSSVCTDASLDAGAAYYIGDFVFSNWGSDIPALLPHPINVKELYAILLAFRRWQYPWSSKTMHIFTDNKGAEWALRRGLTKNIAANAILRKILWISAYYNITLNVHCIPSRDNTIADSISRMNNTPVGSG